MTNEGEVSYGNVVRNGPLQPLNVQTDADIWEQASIVNWNRAVQQERERCAKIAENTPSTEWADWDLKSAGHEIANRIRTCEDTLQAHYLRSLRPGEVPVIMTNIQVPE